MIKDWLKKILPCHYCQGAEVSFYYSDKKIKRYGVLCDKCGRMIGWLPSSLEDRIEIEGYKIKEREAYVSRSISR